MSKNTNQKDAYNDLCVTCKNFSSCIYVKNGNRPVHYCEEFEVYTYSPATEITSPVSLKVKKKEEKLIFYGLCKNCGNRMTCMMASPDRIIWHCEEYV
jgi:hypothetical protein